MAAVVADRVAPADALLLLADTRDLADVRMNLADPEDGCGLSGAQIDVMGAEYRKFLALQLAYPDAEIVPCKLADDMWHQHILDTTAYREDSQRSSVASWITTRTSGCATTTARRCTTRTPAPCSGTATRSVSLRLTRGSPPMRHPSASAPRKPQKCK
jgi:hypothetical protein